jgi:hypothetical protein
LRKCLVKDGWVEWAERWQPSTDEGLWIEEMRVESNGKKRGRKMMVEEVFYGGHQGRFPV